MSLLHKLKKQVKNWVLVDFDLELGPTVVSVFPSLNLSYAERENMYVRSSGLLLPQTNYPVKCILVIP